ncbi:MAG: hypothetical protein KDB37_18205 [Ilumatobacter sp.]|nr:hypothetical protein [Ilumatobacter sp.]
MTELLDLGLPAGSDAPPLATGWDLDAPIGDTIIRRYLHHWAAYCDAYATAGGGVTLDRRAYRVGDLRRPSGYFNSVTLMRPLTDGVLDRIEADLVGGTGEVLLWSAWPTPDLTHRGWSLVGHPPLLIRPPAAVLPAPQSSVEVDRVTSPDELQAWERVAIDGYPLDELRDADPGDLAAPCLLDDDRFAFWVGRVGGDPVSIGTSFVEHGIGSFALGVTMPDARRRGHWLAHATARLRHSPDVWMTGVFSDFSRPGAESIGFVPITRLTLWALPRP